MTPHSPLKPDGGSTEQAPPSPAAPLPWRQRQFRIPRRFNMTLVMMFTVMAAIMLAILQALGCSPRLSGFLLLTAVAIAFGQTVAVNHPKLVSVGIGMLLTAVAFGVLAAVTVGRFGPPLEAVLFGTLIFIAGAPIGYLMGTLVAGVALLADRVDAALRRKPNQPQEHEEWPAPSVRPAVDAAEASQANEP